MVTSQALYLALLGLLGVERGVELAISRAHARAAFARGGFEVGRAHYRVMAALHGSFFVACASEVLLFDRRFAGTLGVFAALVVLGAQVLRYAAVATLGPQWNVRIIVWPDAAPVTTGLYRFIRHPNYVAVVLELLFVPLVHGAFITAAVYSMCNAALLSVRIREEERALGAGYARAFRDRPRFVPRLFGG
jgi:methyltransferase